MNKRRVSFLALILMFFGATLSCGNNCEAISAGESFANTTLPFGQFDMFSQNNIVFYDPSECISASGGGMLGSLSGSTFKEKMWCALTSVAGLDKGPAAGMMANSLHEGGLAQWEDTYIQNGHFINGLTFDRLYNGTYTESIGVGMFGFTSGLSDFLHYINDNDPSLIKYFEDLKYSVSSEKLLEMIDENDFDKLLQLELKYFFEVHAANHFAFKIDVFKQKSDAGEAARYFAHEYERCAACGYKGGSGQLTARAADARKVYDEFKDFQCSGSASIGETSTGSVSDLGTITSGVTLIGDSISVFSESELVKKFPNGFLSKVGSRHSTSGGACSGDEGGLSVLKKIVNGTGNILNQHQNQSDCESVAVDSSSLKENVVWALGTNANGANESTLNEVLSLIGGRKLFLVTPFNNGAYKSNTDDIAETYRKFANNHDNVYIVDWNKEVRDNVSTYILSDNVHPTKDGTELFARLIYEALSGSKDCTTYSGDYPQYDQGDPKWSGVSYGGGGNTIGSSGCGPSSLAMLVTAATGQDVLPTDIAELTNDCAYFSGCGFLGRESNTVKVCEKYGCEAKKLPNNDEETIRQALKDGWMIHLSGHGNKGDGATNSFQSNGHYIGYFSIDAEDNVMVADSAGYKNENRKNRKMAFEDAVKGRWTDRPIMAIRGKGGDAGKNTCTVAGNYCATSGGAAMNVAVEGGLTREQIETLAGLYNSDGTTSKGQSNCPAVVKWFMEHYTDLGHPGSTGNGKHVAYNMANQFGLPHGNEPRPFAIFSTLSYSAARDGNGELYGHTGIVLAVNGDELLTLETLGQAGVYVRSAKKMNNNPVHPDYVYTYLDEHVDASKISEVLGGV